MVELGVLGAVEPSLAANVPGLMVSTEDVLAVAGASTCSANVQLPPALNAPPLPVENEVPPTTTLPAVKAHELDVIASGPIVTLVGKLIGEAAN